MHESKEDQRKAKAISLGSHGAWAKWESATSRNITWHDMFKKEPIQLGSLLRTVNDLLPTIVNLKKWYNTKNDDCALCTRRCTLAHVLSSCKTALTQDRYRWRHNKVLELLATMLVPITKSEKRRTKTVRFINFVRPGEAPKKTQKKHMNTDDSE